MFGISREKINKNRRRALLFCLRIHRYYCLFATRGAARINLWFAQKITPKIIFYAAGLDRYPNAFFWLLLFDLIAIYFFFFGRKVGLTIEYYGVLKTLRGPWGHESSVDYWCPFF